EGVWHLADRRHAAAEWMPQAPATVVEPGPRVRQAFGLEAEQVANRALQADRRRVRTTDRGKAPVRTVETGDDDPGRLLVQESHMDGLRLAPKPKQGSP